MKYKVGDLVQVINDDGFFHAGDIQPIIQIDRIDGELSYALENNDGWTEDVGGKLVLYISPDNIRLYKEKRLKVKIKKLEPNAVIPSYAKDGDAGLDLTATSVTYTDEDKTYYGTGLAFEIPKGYVGLVFPRSSIHKTPLTLSNSCGIIDSGYRGEVKAVFRNNGRHDSLYKIGDRIAQIIILPYPEIELEEVDELSSTERGEGGFGSSGK
jgi:dUTP pyrophosphatase